MLAGVVACGVPFRLDPDVLFLGIAPIIVLAAPLGPMLMLLGLTVFRKRYRMLVLLLAMTITAFLIAHAIHRVRTYTAFYSLYGLSFLLTEENKEHADAAKAVMAKPELIRLFGAALYEQGFDRNLCIDRIEVLQPSPSRFNIEWHYYKALHPKADLPFHIASAYWELKIRWIEWETDESHFRVDRKTVRLHGANGNSYPFDQEGLLQQFADELKRYCNDPTPFVNALAERESDERLRSAASDFLKLDASKTK